MKIFITLINKLFRLFKHFAIVLERVQREREEVYTESLHISCKREKGWVGGCWSIENVSGGYHGIFKRWWDYFGLCGVGLVIGEEGKLGENTKKRLQREYLGIQVRTVGLKNSDYIWDITEPFGGSGQFDWVICQAVLEHVYDPVAAIRNMEKILKPGGMLYIHTHGPSFHYHAYPIDCFRYYRDAFIAISNKTCLKIEDMLWMPDHCFVAYRKGGK